MRTTMPMPPLENDPSLLLAEAVATKIKWSLTLHLKIFLYPLFGHKHSYTSSAFVVSGPVTCTWSPCPWLCSSCDHSIWSPEYSKYPLFCGIVFPIPQTLPLRTFTLSVPTLSFLMYLLDSPQWLDPASNTWQEAKPETLPMELWCLLAPPNSDSIVVITIKILEHLFVFLRLPVLADIPTQFFNSIWACTPLPHSGSVLCHCPYKEKWEIHMPFQI